MASAYRMALSVSVATLLAFAPHIGMAADAATDDAATTPPAIVVATAETRTVVDRVIATGTVQPVEEIYVAPLVEGLSIRSLAVDVGDRVEADQTLATLNNDMLLLQKSQSAATLAKARAGLAQTQALLAEAKATANEALSARERAQRLAKSGTQSQALLDQAMATAEAALARANSAEHAIAVSEADIQMVEAQIADIDLRLARTAVTSPVAGTVAARSAKVGAIASGAATPLFTIIRDGAVELKADVAEDTVLKLAPGQKATISLAGGAAVLTGSIRLVAPTLDTDSRLGQVFIRFDDPGKARAGMFASAEIVAQTREGIVLPLSAVTTARNETLVRKVVDGIIRLVPVKTGIQDGQVIEIVSGLAAGDVVVAKAGAYVRDGDRINPVRPEHATTD